MNYIEMFDDQMGVAMGDNAAALANLDVLAKILSTNDGSKLIPKTQPMFAREIIKIFISAAIPEERT